MQHGRDTGQISLWKQGVALVRQSARGDPEPRHGAATFARAFGRCGSAGKGGDRCARYGRSHARHCRARRAVRFLIGDRRLAPLKADAAGYVASFRYHDRMTGIPVHDEQGTRDRPYDLIVSFDAAKVDAALRSLGLAPWTGPRPRLAMFVGVQNGPVAYVLASDGERGLEQKLSLEAAAHKRGLSIVLPGSSL